LPHNEAPFNWTSDGCSLPAPVADNELFREACDLHDFGYRNYGHGLALSPNEDTRNWIDDRFRDEMNRICDNTYSGWRNTSCRWDAGIYYGGVRHRGRDAYYHG
jgi:Prokaryotic phospholipase A2